ncbi:MAG: MBOAT family protein [Phycisphaerales bacterium]|nr:MBOAT family protein [Phycisphaerales bacterium]
MIFTSFAYVYFLAFVVAGYWLLRRRMWQNMLLLIASYVFYGYVHPWFCYLIAGSTVLDYLCGLGMQRFPAQRKWLLLASLVGNLGMLGVFKYFDFFADNFALAVHALGFQMDPIAVRLFLPVGISFYTFQTLSYTIDIYRGEMEPRRNFIDFALFVSFFPQLVAGPIERATHFLPQIESERKWYADVFISGWPLIIRGYLKKLVIADNVSVYADKVYMLDHPTALLLAAGTLAFAVQILADFSAYTDIARGSARLLGFELMENFDSPYLAVSPSDFWRRWHISFSTWIRDYIYIPLGGSRVKTATAGAVIVLISMGLSGLWHGAAWHFVAWGIYHAILLIVYRQFGFSGRWKPATRLGLLVSWALMFFLTLTGWAIFRTSSMSWLAAAATDMSMGISGDSLVAALAITALVGLYSSPLIVSLILSRRKEKSGPVSAVAYALAICIIVLFAQESGQDFIYFQF